MDATLKTIDRITGVPGALNDYAIQAITQGEDAVGEVSVQVAFGDEQVAAKKGKGKKRPARGKQGRQP